MLFFLICGKVFIESLFLMYVQNISAKKSFLFLALQILLLAAIIFVAPVLSLIASLCKKILYLINIPEQTLINIPEQTMEAVLRLGVLNLNAILGCITFYFFQKQLGFCISYKKIFLCNSLLFIVTFLLAMFMFIVCALLQYYS